ncbi:plasmid stabilization protein [Citrobacter portucalensis]|uniref:type II toxin-antitoxin system Phd/YefM family antitoxin n=1 Tax=Citrobacter portucalensis TaxID=1639133 RepID=UPI00226B765D|nr:plasmid stabilization protein [Citrobacter portucalensis]MCX9019058.1 plasmid stabilization protein [Citrobacter portucalensis]
MTTQVMTRNIASITDLKKDPMGTVKAAEGAAVAIFNRNTPAFYCVPAAAYEAIMEALDDAELVRIANERSSEEVISVNLDDL